MLIEKAPIGGDEFGASSTTDVFHGPRMKLIFDRHDGAIVDESVFTNGHPLRTDGLSAVSCILSGRGFAFRNNRLVELRPGDFVATDDSSQIRFIQDGRSEQFCAATLCWEPGVDTPLSEALDHGKLSKSDLARLRLLAPPSTKRVFPSEGRILATDVREILRSVGIPLAELSASDLEERAPVRQSETEWFDDFTDALRKLDAQPMLVDLESTINVSPRQVQRQFAKLQARFRLKSWRKYLTALRTMTACTLLSAPKATTERVAQAVGYGSPAAFCHAFARAKLPSPGTVRSEALAK